MDKPVSSRQTLKRIVILALLAVIPLLGVVLFSPHPDTAHCTGNCQACYCDDIKKIDGVDICYVNGQPSSCIGCVGSCNSDDNCEAKPGVGGCGSVIAWARNSDCRYTPPPPANTPTPTPTPTPPPPESCPVRTWVLVHEPESDEIEHEPPYPLVARQDTTNTGFVLHFNVTGGWAKKYEQEPKQMCRTRSQTYPDDCPNDWEWVCVRNVIEQYDDPIIEVDLGMRLGDGVREWIENDLGSRYYGAHVQDDLPRVWELYKGGGVMSWSSDFEYHPYDPGVHGGRLIVTIKGTPLNPPQHVSFPYTVPVYLWDTTEGE